MTSNRTRVCRWSAVGVATAMVAWATPAMAADPCSPMEEMACAGNATIDLVGLMEGADYQGFEGGLFPGASNSASPEHACAGVQAAEGIAPRSASGEIDEQNGRIVMMSIGMSNTTQEYQQFLGLFANSPDYPARNPALRAVDGAQGGHDANAWAPGPEFQSTWDDAVARLSNPQFGGEQGLTPEQVQVVWIKQALAGPMNLSDADYDCGDSPCGEFPGHARALQQQLSAIIDEAGNRFPNLAVAYVSSRTSSYVLFPDDGPGLNPEPFAFESGYSVKWLVEDRMGAAGPHVTWGPYLWAHSECRADGFRWCCNYTADDATHPSNTGRTEVANALMSFFSTDSSATGWFLADPPAPPDCTDPGGDTGGSDGGDGGASTSGDGGADAGGDATADGGAGDATAGGGSDDTAGADGGGDDGGGCGCRTDEERNSGLPWLLVGCVAAFTRRSR